MQEMAWAVFSDISYRRVSKKETRVAETTAERTDEGTTCLFLF